MKKEKDIIQKENVVRIYDDELLNMLNDEYSKLQGFVYSSRNAF